jgi:acyl carrier protein
MSAEVTWPPEFEAVLREHLPGLAADAQLACHLRLADYGLNSLGVVSLLVGLEDEFGVLFPDELLAAATFETPGALWKVLQEVR